MTALPDPLATLRLTDAQWSMLASHASVWPRPVAWTSLLGSLRTWHCLYDKGMLRGNTLTEAGRIAVVRRYGKRHFPEGIVA